MPTAAQCQAPSPLCAECYGSGWGEQTAAAVFKIRSSQ